MRPKRPYKSLSDFRRYILSNLCDWRRGGPLKPVKWPCTSCYGSGIISWPSGVYQERPTRVRCNDCGGTGEGTKDACQDSYDHKIQQWREDLAEYEARRSGLAKLTSEERRALGV